MNTFDKHDLSGSVGKHLVHTRDSGWNYEIYVKDGHTLDYRIHNGVAGNRWVRDQGAYIVRTGESIYKVFRTRPIGTSVSLIVNLGDKLFRSTIFFPRWIMNNPEKTVCFQNDHIPLMNSCRDAGPAYPTEVIDELATVTSIRDCDADDDEAINCPADGLPADFPVDL